MDSTPNPHPRSRRSTKWRNFILLALAILSGAWFLSSFSPMADPRHWPARFESNGERIYFTGTSSSGQAIASRGGGMHMEMMKGGCVVCHGSDRQGGRLMNRFWQVVPPITSAALFGEHDEDRNSDAHGDHDNFTEESLGRTITEGIDPSGKPLDPAMPRWTMSIDDLADLVSYLKASKTDLH